MGQCLSRAPPEGAKAKYSTAQRIAKAAVEVVPGPVPAKQPSAAHGATYKAGGGLTINVNDNRKAKTDASTGFKSGEGGLAHGPNGERRSPRPTFRATAQAAAFVMKASKAAVNKGTINFATTRSRSDDKSNSLLAEPSSSGSECGTTSSDVFFQSKNSNTLLPAIREVSAFERSSRDSEGSVGTGTWCRGRPAGGGANGARQSRQAVWDAGDIREIKEGGEAQALSDSRDTPVKPLSRYSLDDIANERKKEANGTGSTKVATHDQPPQLMPEPSVPGALLPSPALMTSEHVPQPPPPLQPLLLPEEPSTPALPSQGSQKQLRPARASEPGALKSTSWCQRDTSTAAATSPASAATPMGLSGHRSPQVGGPGGDGADTRWAAPASPGDARNSPRSAAAAAGAAVTSLVTTHSSEGGMSSKAEPQSCARNPSSQQTSSSAPGAESTPLPALHPAADGHTPFASQRLPAPNRSSLLLRRATANRIKAATGGNEPPPASGESSGVLNDGSQYGLSNTSSGHQEALDDGQWPADAVAESTGTAGSVNRALEQLRQWRAERDATTHVSDRGSGGGGTSLYGPSSDGGASSVGAATGTSNGGASSAGGSCGGAASDGTGSVATSEGAAREPTRAVLQRLRTMAAERRGVSSMSPERSRLSYVPNFAQLQGRTRRPGLDSPLSKKQLRGPGGSKAGTAGGVEEVEDEALGKRREVDSDSSDDDVTANDAKTGAVLAAQIPQQQLQPGKQQHKAGKAQEEKPSAIAANTGTSRSTAAAAQIERKTFRPMKSVSERNITAVKNFTGTAAPIPAAAVPAAVPATVVPAAVPAAVLPAAVSTIIGLSNVAPAPSIVFLSGASGPLVTSHSSSLPTDPNAMRPKAEAPPPTPALTQSKPHGQQVPGLVSDMDHLHQLQRKQEGDSSVGLKQLREWQQRAQERRRHRPIYMVTRGVSVSCDGASPQQGPQKYLSKPQPQPQRSEQLLLPSTVSAELQPVQNQRPRELRSRDAMPPRRFTLDGQGTGRQGELRPSIKPSADDSALQRAFSKSSSLPKVVLQRADASSSVKSLLANSKGKPAPSEQPSGSLVASGTATVVSGGSEVVGSQSQGGSSLQPQRNSTDSAQKQAQLQRQQSQQLQQQQPHVLLLQQQQQPLFLLQQQPAQQQPLLLLQQQQQHQPLLLLQHSQPQEQIHQQRPLLLLQSNLQQPSHFTAPGWPSQPAVMYAGPQQPYNYGPSNTASTTPSTPTTASFTESANKGSSALKAPVGTHHGATSSINMGAREGAGGHSISQCSDKQPSAARIAESLRALEQQQQQQTTSTTMTHAVPPGVLLLSNGGILTSVRMDGNGAVVGRPEQQHIRLEVVNGAVTVHEDHSPKGRRTGVSSQPYTQFVVPSQGIVYGTASAQPRVHFSEF